MAKTTNDKFELMDADQTAFSQLVEETNANWETADQALTDLSSTAANKGASLIGLADAAGKYNATNVEAAFLEIKATTSGALSMQASYTAENLSLKKDFIGRIVLSVNVKKDGSAFGTSPEHVATLPTGFRPLDMIRFAATGYQGELARGYINTSGQIFIHLKESNVSRCAFLISYDTQ